MISAMIEKITHLLIKLTAEKNTLKLKDKMITERFKMPCNSFVIVAIDKTVAKIIFICQTPYVQVLIDEIGLKNINNITST